MFVFRNNTIERFFPKGYSFSGYEDISNIPMDDDGYVWFYQVPIKVEYGEFLSEIQLYIQKLKYVLSHVGDTRLFIILTMESLQNFRFIDSDYSLYQAMGEYNNSLIELSRTHINVKLIDFSEFLQRYSCDDIFDWKFYFLSQMGLNPKLSKDFQSWWQKKLDSIALKRKKCLILDLDNTLWGGILGEDGVEGIQIGDDYPGKAFSYFQKILLKLSQQGIILTICSKNNEEDVLDVWEKNPFMILKKDNFVATRINWDDKASNIKSLSEELNIGLDSMVFVDDNPTEREWVHSVLPEVVVPEFPKQPYELPSFVFRLINDYFKVYSITEEDSHKTDYYKANTLRKQSRNEFANLEDFLRNLEISITIEQVNEFNISRIAQLTQKTNQFNLTTKRYTDAEIRNFVENGWDIWCLKVSDRFGDSGITGCVMVNGNDIDTYLLSCRVLGRNIEDAFIKQVLLLLKNKNIDTVKAHYIQSTKNKLVENYWSKIGFQLISQTGLEKDYELNLMNTELVIENYYHIVVK